MARGRALGKVNEAWGLTGQSRYTICRVDACAAHGRLIRHARYFILQLAESQLTQRLFAQIIRGIERLAWHPT